MLRPPRVGAYSDKYKRAVSSKQGHTHTSRFESGVPDVVEDERTKELRREAAQRRRYA